MRPFTFMAAQGSGYTRTAFVSSTGDDGTAALNDPLLPWQTLNAALDALAGAYGGLATTIRVMDDLAGGIDDTANWDTLLAAGVTIMSHGVTQREIGGDVKFGTATGALLTLDNIEIIALTKASDPTGVGGNAGTITGTASALIQTLALNSTYVPSAANAGSNGADGQGSAGANGNDGDPPEAGADGGDYDGSGGTGSTGAAGGNAWNLTLAGSGLVNSALNGTGSKGGTGGVGGIGVGGTGGTAGQAVGGAGGHGGNSTAILFQDGGNGGNGGDGTSNGGAGGAGGVGGNGSTITKAAGWTIPGSPTLTAGVGGDGGAGGLHGTATLGGGGTGGTGAFGGAQGAAGSDGTATQNDGSAGGTGAAGSDGSVI